MTFLAVWRNGIPMLRSAAHHRLLSDGLIESVAPEFEPLTSLTSISIDAAARA
jgi:hypothetical protein